MAEHRKPRRCLVYLHLVYHRDGQEGERDELDQNGADGAAWEYMDTPRNCLL